MGADGQFLQRFVKRCRKVVAEWPRASGRGKKVMVLGRKRYRGLEQCGETAQRVVVGASLVNRRREVGGNAVEYRLEQVHLGGKPTVERAFADPGRTSDVLGRGLGTRRRVDAARGDDDALGVARRVRT